MAKLPKEETLERCRIHADTSIDKVGRVLKMLTLMGVDNVGYEFITDVLLYKNGKRHETSGMEFATAWIADHPRFDVRELLRHFTEADRSSTAVYGILKAMVENGALTKIDARTYQVGTVKALPPPPYSKPPKKVRRKPPPGKKPYHPSNKNLIIHTVADRDEFHTKELSALFKENGRPENSVGAVLTKMTDDKFFLKLGGGKYRVLQKTKKEAARLQGDGAETTKVEAGE